MSVIDQMSKVAGHPVELTIRGDRSFTWSFEQADESAAKRIVEFFGENARCTYEIDAECGTFVYVEA